MLALFSFLVVSCYEVEVCLQCSLLLIELIVWLWICMMVVFRDFQGKILCGDKINVCLDIGDVSMELS